MEIIINNSPKLSRGIIISPSEKALIGKVVLREVRCFGEGGGRCSLSQSPREARGAEGGKAAVAGGPTGKRNCKHILG